ncbi:unnamed protein product [Vitrella brassicaformis CCMP3155]|uniref:Uncharacterized protein n=1 Tax=Vitrella brassicaformis (strain CCMP3155) TaxID=1169540 RepID=A0A0G4GPJ5_VITBC|nr:unnamed protein product [Vitrella brassicaformis CCMP3155]|eukprot:CEM32281.1 unnamed protein product [Vitrella brassicaformis CCMP3155]
MTKSIQVDLSTDRTDSFADVWRENKEVGMDVPENINALLWYCLYLEQSEGKPRGCYDVAKPSAQAAETAEVVSL